MGKNARAIVATCWLSVVCAEAALSGISLTTTSFSKAPIATIVAGTGVIPADDVDLAATYLTSIANTYQAAIVDTLLANATNAEKLLNPEAYYSYGRSPPVYPSPQGEGSGEWAAAYSKAKALVAQMTNEEKNNITSPSADAGGCSGFTGSVPRLGFPGICLNDAESGIRASTEYVNGYASQISVGASFDKGLAYQRAKYLGAEFKAKGINVALGPVVGPLGRVAKGGRNWEGFSNDPYLAGSLVEPTVQGLQESVIACVKHFIANEQETNRNPFVQGFLAPIGINLNNSVSSNLDDRTMHELYLWPFYDAVHAGAGSV
nr:putative beta-glucosidase m [Quercus suber]